MAGKASAEVLIDGEKLEKKFAIQLTQPLHGHHGFTVSFPVSEQHNTLVEHGEQYVGKKITILLTPGYKRIGGRLQFEGVITRIHLSKHEVALTHLVLSGFSPTILMDDGPHLQSWEEMTLEEVAKAVCNKYDISVMPDILYGEVIPYVTQYRETSFNFLSRQLATYGEWCYYDGLNLVLGAPPAEEEQSLTFGKELTSMDVETIALPTDFKLLSYDYVQDKHFEATGAAARVSSLDQFGKVAEKAGKDLFTGTPQLVEPFYNTSKGQLEDHAVRRRSQGASSTVMVNGRSDFLGLRLGQVIKINALEYTTGAGAGTIDYGSYRIVSLNHQVTPAGGYTNNFTAIPSTLEVPPAQRGTIRPPVAERQPALVVDNDDPEGLGRVRVSFPWQEEEGQMTPWVRVATAAAGAGHGNYFVPEIGDQVLIDFTWNNPDLPLVIGSLYNKATKHEGAYTSGNSLKIIRTRSGNQIMLGDDGGGDLISITNGTNVITLSMEEDASITISTDGDLTLNGKNVTINAEESFTLASGTAELNSEKETTITSGTDLTIDAGSALLAKACNDAALEGMNVNIEAGVALKAKGSVSADLDSVNTNVKGSAMVNVSGALVKLN